MEAIYAVSTRQLGNLRSANGGQDWKDRMKLSV